MIDVKIVPLPYKYKHCRRSSTVSKWHSQDFHFRSVTERWYFCHTHSSLQPNTWTSDHDLLAALNDIPNNKQLARRTKGTAVAFRLLRSRL